jgi:hypothetical protein
MLTAKTLRLLPLTMIYLDELKSRITRREIAILDALRVETRLRKVVSSSSGVRAFISAFYFIRYRFYKLNFIVGARCPPHESFWSGLALNLMEELGGRLGPTHNQLYRDVLMEVDIENEESLPEPEFAHIFNEEWEKYCMFAPLKQALIAIAIYEILDNPDYQTLLSVIKSSDVGPNAHTFFHVHAHAQHFKLFESLVLKLCVGREDAKLFRDAEAFVLGRQRVMWCELLNYLEGFDKRY